jgi:hypothetical protein
MSVSEHFRLRFVSAKSRKQTSVLMEQYRRNVPKSARETSERRRGQHVPLLLTDVQVAPFRLVLKRWITMSA